ncbi:helix-turn-helix transcriptional regulator [Thermocatellispora tengchongensis]
MGNRAEPGGWSSVAGEEAAERVLEREQAAKMLVGARLRDLRKAAGLPQKVAADEIGASVPKISNIARGVYDQNRDDVVELLNLYGVRNPHEQRVILSILLGERLPQWWDGTDSPWQEYAAVGLEQTAELISVYAPDLVPPLLQTPEYAAEVARISTFPPLPEDAVRAQVDSLLRRQERLHSTGGPRLWAIIEAPALWRSIAGPDVQRRQLDALICAARRTNISIQINPMRARFTPVSRGRFAIYRYAPEDQPDLVVLGKPPDAFAVYERDEMNHYTALFDQLAVAAHGPARAAGMLTAIRDRLHEIDSADTPTTER